jgi:multicomponent Na+:H+ antiporter subunit D
MLSFFITTPLLLLLMLNLPLRALMKKIVYPAGLAAAFAQTVIIASAVFGFWDIRSISVSPFFKFNLGADNLSLLLLFCNGLVVFVAMLTAYSFTRAGEQRFNFINLLLIVLAGSNGIALVRDIFTLYVFLEVVSVTSFILISFDKGHNALEGTFKYIVLSAAATVLILSAIALILLVTGDTSFESVGIAVDYSKHSVLVGFASAIFLSGLFIKSGLVPFHGWLPDAYTSAPASVSVFLAGIATKALGVYAIMRLVISVFGFDNPINKVLLLLGAISVIFGALGALTQNDFKRMLSYSSISQVGYIMLGVGCATGLGVAAAVFHFFNHAVLKSLLFVNSASIEKQTGTRDMNKLGGLTDKMPVTGITATIATLSNAGVPPLAGFWSKLLIIVALWSSGHYAYAAIAALAGVLTLAYMLTLQRRVFFGKLADNLANVKEAAFNLRFASIFLASIILGVGLFFPFGLCKLIIP